MNLQNIRQEIDKVDLQLLKLLKKRGELVRKIGRYKKANGLPIKDPTREEQVMGGILQHVSSDQLLVKFVKKIWRSIFEYSYKLE